MHAVVARSKLHRFQRGREYLREHIVPRVAQAPGIVGAFWFEGPDDRVTSMLFFESEDVARAMADQIPRESPGGVTTVESIEVGELVETA